MENNSSSTLACSQRHTANARYQIYVSLIHKHLHKSATRSCLATSLSLSLAFCSLSLKALLFANDMKQHHTIQFYGVSFLNNAIFCQAFLPPKKIDPVSLFYCLSKHLFFRLDFSTYSVFTVDEDVAILPYLQSFDRFVLKIYCGIVARKRWVCLFSKTPR